MTETLRFDPDDFEVELLEPGDYLPYPATIDVARYQRSRTGSETIQVVYALELEREHPAHFSS